MAAAMVGVDRLLLMQNFLTGTGVFTGGGDLIGLTGDRRGSYIDCFDIAASGAALLSGPVTNRGTCVVTAPEALTQVEIAAKLSAAFRSAPEIR